MRSLAELPYQYAKEGRFYRIVQDQVCNDGREKVRALVRPDGSPGEKIGFITFWVEQATRRVTFSGMKVSSRFRRQGHASALMDEMDNLAEICGGDFVDTTVQRKPLICAMLVRRGFVPASRRRKGVFVEAKGRCFGGEVNLSFLSEDASGRFQRSQPYRADNYSLSVGTVQPMGGGGDWVVLGVPYRRELEER